jgi:hypothetical protein
LRSAIGPYAADRALPQETLQAAEDPSEITTSESWIPIADVELPFPEIELNSTAANRFVHGQEVVVFKSGVQDIDKDCNVVVRAADKSLLGVGMVRAVLARGRTLNITPSMVLDTASITASAAKEQAGHLP